MALLRIIFEIVRSWRDEVIRLHKGVIDMIDKPKQVLEVYRREMS
jgi:ABC-type polysaccharide/polyol phosphate transport system ATPase subunit